jgi:hypothetical protein
LNGLLRRNTTFGLQQASPSFERVNGDQSSSDLRYAGLDGAGAAVQIIEK